MVIDNGVRWSGRFGGTSSRRGREFAEARLAGARWTSAKTVRCKNLHVAEGILNAADGGGREGIRGVEDCSNFGGSDRVRVGASASVTREHSAGDVGIHRRHFDGVGRDKSDSGYSDHGDVL